MTTLKEIAERAGVSIGTVDRVLHNRGRVSQENIDKIMKIASEYDYVPNQLARRLKTRQEVRFGVLIPSIGSELGYWQQIELGIREAKEELQTLDVDIIYSYFDRKIPGSYLKAAEELVARNVTAYITAPLMADEVREVCERYPDIPCVFIDSSLPDLSAKWDFSQDPVKAGKVAARLMHAFDSEIDNVITIQTFKSVFNGEMRVRSFIDEFSHYTPEAAIRNIYVTEGASIKDDLSVLTDFKGKHNGIFVVNDGVHVICDILDELGISECFKVIGFDLSPENRACLEQGKVEAILGQGPRNQGYEAAMMLYKVYVLGKSEHGNYQASVDIYIKENISDSVYWG